MKDSLRRIGAIWLRHWFLLRSSVPRIINMMFWPMLAMLQMGFLNVYLAQQPQTVMVIGLGMLIGATLLWEVNIRANMGVMMGFMEELWSSHFTHLFISPLRAGEYLAGIALYGLFTALVSVVPAVLLAIVLFDYSLFDLGPGLAAFYLSLLLSGWWMGFILVAMLQRWGLATEYLAWMLMFFLSPFVAVIYPVAALPEWVQPFSWLLPQTYVFEGMRALMQNHNFNWQYWLTSMGLNLLYLATAVSCYLLALRAARRTGRLLSMGE